MTLSDMSLSFSIFYRNAAPLTARSAILPSPPRAQAMMR